MELTVLKGIPLENRKLDLSSDILFVNRFKYFSNLMETEVNTISYEEYLLLKSFCDSQFSSIKVKSDNRFIYHYPVLYNLNEESLEQLCQFYNSDSDEQSEVILSRQAEFYRVFISDVLKINGRFYVTYVDFDTLPNSINIEYVEVYDRKEELTYCNEPGLAVYDIITEEDYIKFLKKLEVEELYNYYINISGSEFNFEFIKSKLSVLHSIYSEKCNLHLVNDYVFEREIFDNSEYIKILQKFWMKSDFLSFNIYNLDKLDDGEIETISIYQDQIIHDVVSQIELCRKNDSYKDIFVTAPTGSGKSAIFQIPAIYIAEKYNLMTLVISPLIGLMADQIDNLESKGYSFARTINSDVSPIIKSQIMHDIETNRCHILYISPESLMGKSDLVGLIGNRTVGMIVIDEAHIVTTWGKQFRPDYWYLGDHIQHLRKKQLETKQQSFIISTFTATAIYRGIEDMYGETKSSLQMINPITYLGEVRRKNIEIDVSEVPMISKKEEYEENKFTDLLNIIKKSLLSSRKVLVYFPTKPLITRFFKRCEVDGLSGFVSIYHGGMEATSKQENAKNFKDGSKLVMLATKAFGMGIDIDDIADVIHFSPTGNVCDYVQEIGRAARNRSISGRALYHYMSSDFKHINRLHGMSTIKNYQLVKVMEKILEIFTLQLKSGVQSKKRNSMLIDAENFAYIFENKDEDLSINKVKTALLLIQKDFLLSRGYTPFRAKPIPLFAYGFFHIEKKYINRARETFNNNLSYMEGSNNIFKLDLKTIWEQSKQYQEYSFPQFKYYIYSRDNRLPNIIELNLNPALEFQIAFQNEFDSRFNLIVGCLQEIVNDDIQSGKYIGIDYMSSELCKKTRISHYQSTNIISIFLSSLEGYKEYVNNNIFQRLYNPRYDENSVIYKFNNTMDEYFRWLRKEYLFFKKEYSANGLYLINSPNSTIKGKVLSLGILESFGVLTFKALGGTNSQIYIYINQTQSMYDIVNKPSSYRNRILEKVGDRHIMSVEMMKYIFESNLSSEEIWDSIESYFLGNIPKMVLQNYSNHKKAIR